MTRPARSPSDLVSTRARETHPAALARIGGRAPRRRASPVRRSRRSAPSNVLRPPEGCFRPRRGRLPGAEGPVAAAETGSRSPAKVDQIDLGAKDSPKHSNVAGNPSGMPSRISRPEPWSRPHMRGCVRMQASTSRHNRAHFRDRLQQTIEVTSGPQARACSDCMVNRNPQECDILLAPYSNSRTHSRNQVDLRAEVSSQSAWRLPHSAARARACDEGSLY